MRRTALIAAPLLALSVVAGCTMESPDTRPCPLGTWKASASQVNAVIGGPNPYVKATGTFVFQFAEDGTFDWRWDQTFRHPGDGDPAEFTFDATMSGEWSGSPDNLTLTFTRGAGTMTHTARGMSETTDIRDSFDIDAGMVAGCSGSDMAVRLNSAVVVPLKRK